MTVTTATLLKGDAKELTYLFLRPNLLIKTNNNRTAKTSQNSEIAKSTSPYDLMTDLFMTVGISWDMWKGNRGWGVLEFNHNLARPLRNLASEQAVTWPVQGPDNVILQCPDSLCKAGLYMRQAPFNSGLRTPPFLPPSLLLPPPPMLLCAFFFSPPNKTLPVSTVCRAWDPLAQTCQGHSRSF